MLPDSMLEYNLRWRVASYPGQRRGSSASNTPSCVILQKPELRVKGYEPVELKEALRFYFRCMLYSAQCLYGVVILISSENKLIHRL